MNNNTVLSLIDLIARTQYPTSENPINFVIEKQQHWTLIGSNGSGKTFLADIIAGKYALKQGSIHYFDENNNEISVSKAVKSISFRDIYSIADVKNSYYQQRWNRGDELEAPIVKDILPEEDSDKLNTLLKWFDANDLLFKKINLLSSGELRKTLIIRSILSNPRILIIDNPFIGLDAASRDILSDVLTRLSELQQTQIILLVSDPDDIPPFITDVLAVTDKYKYQHFERKAFENNPSLTKDLFGSGCKSGNAGELKKLYSSNSLAFEFTLQMKKIHIEYDGYTILKDLEWNVRRGEKWALLGQNGAGKSTLLSLIVGDNPQAYANNIRLFDRQKGSGESIWDIKKRIGYVSPEMHLYYQKNVKTKDIVCSGFFDTIGLYKKCSEDEESIALEWMELFGIGHLAESPFLKISFGEQRLALLARAFVKNPDLLVLDEPLHGLDVSNKKIAKKIIEEFCDDSKTLIYVTHYQSEIPSCINNFKTLKKNLQI